MSWQSIRLSRKTTLASTIPPLLDRVGCLLACAAQLALADSGWCPERLREKEVGLVVGTMFSTAHTIGEFDRHALREGPCYASPMTFANTVLNAPAGQTAIVHGLRGVNSTVATGATSGLQRWGMRGPDSRQGGAVRSWLVGWRNCRSSRLAVSGGRVGSASGDGRYRSAPQRTGFLLGEGAAVLMLEDAGTSAARRRRRPGALHGFG